MADEWDSAYKFRGDDVTVVLQHHLDKNLRVGKDDGATLGHNGGFGKFARWKVSITKEDDDVIAMFQNTHSESYLRIMKNGEDINAGGKGGGLCKFKVHRVSSAVVKLESVKAPGSYVAVSNDGVIVGKGGKRCRIEALKQGPPENFGKKYGFHKENTVVMEHRDEKCLRVKPDDMEQVCSEGGKGEFAQWTAIPSDDGQVVQFQSKKTERYLRMKPDGEVDVAGGGGGWTFFKVHQVGAKNEVRLESQKFEGKYLMFDPQNNTLVSSDQENKKSIFTIFRE